MLIGGLSTGGSGYHFTGVGTDVLLVSRASILAALPACGPQYMFFSRVVSTTLQPEYLTKQQILDNASIAYNNYINSVQTLSEAGYRDWFALALLRPDLITVSDGDQLDFGMWGIAALGVHLIGPSHQCPDNPGVALAWSYAAALTLSWGKKPFLQEAGLTPFLCPQIYTQEVTADFRGTTQPIALKLSTGDSTPLLKPNTCRIVLLSFMQDDSGGPLMPLPPIPEGATTPPPIYGFPDPCDCVGPPGPQGPPGECTDCLKTAEDVALAFADPATTGATQTLMGQATRTYGVNWTGDLVPALGVTALADLKNAVKQFVLSAPEYLFPTPKVVVEEGVPTNLTVETTEEGLPYYQLLMAAAIIQVISQLLDQLTDEECAPGSDTGSFMVKQGATIPFPNFGYLGASQKQLFQTILNKLNALLRCCPDCLETGWVQFAVIQQPSDTVVRLSGEFFIAGGAIPLKARLDGLQVANLGNKVPIATTTDMPQLSKFGRVWWLFEDNTRSEDIFIEHQDVELLTKRGDVVGFGYAFTLGVDCTFNILYSIPPAFQTP